MVKKIRLRSSSYWESWEFVCSSITCLTISASFSRSTLSVNPLPFQLKLCRVSRSNLHSLLYFQASCITSFNFSSSFSPGWDNRGTQEVWPRASLRAQQTGQLFLLTPHKPGNGLQTQYSCLKVLLTALHVTKIPHEPKSQLRGCPGLLFLPHHWHRQTQRWGLAHLGIKGS